MRRALAVIGIVFGTVVVAGLLKGCSSEERPLPLNPGERKLLETQGLGLSLGVRPSTPPVYAQHLVRALRESGLFRKVEPLDKIQAPDLIVTVERHIHGNAVIPILSILTMGLIPTVTNEEHGYSFSLRSPESPEHRVVVEYAHRGYTVLGWVAGVLNFFPQWTGDGIRNDPRFKERLRLAILVKSQAIKNLAVH